MSEIQNSVAQPLNVISLAKSNPSGSVIPGTQLEACIVSKQSKHELKQDLWILVLQGELIIDLPYGDFRLLKKGDSLHIEAGTSISFEPLDEVIVLRTEG